MRKLWHMMLSVELLIAACLLMFSGLETCLSAIESNLTDLNACNFAFFDS